ncbi:MAG: cytochrome c3 family protein [Paracoccus sp. (in: a-proteobacteria)]|nr:cytochrome c3 family protein [Paracoccus sp. (in: a-proteobacteria)]
MTIGLAGSPIGPAAAQTPPAADAPAPEASVETPAIIPEGADVPLPPAGAPTDAAEAPAPDEAAPPSYTLPSVAPRAPDRIPVPNAAEIALWSRSGHADASARAFSHWNDAGEIPANCASCHSGEGFRNFHGLDGSEPGLRDEPFAIGGVVDCATCHNTGLTEIREIALPNGMMHPTAPGEQSCMTCHQGRASGQAIADATEAGDPDTPSSDLRFINPHYATAAAMWLGGYAQLGYEYPGRDYEGRFTHAKPVATCAACHDPHSLEVASSTCLTCHDSGDAKEIRISRTSFDGSGARNQGIYLDIQNNARRLHQMVLDYAAEIAGTPMIYDGARHPYFFADANADGVIDEADGRPVAFTDWTPRLLRAAYNWKFVTADRGAHVHNPHYALQLLHDSMADLAGAMGVDFAQTGVRRD